MSGDMAGSPVINGLLSTDFIQQFFNLLNILKKM